MQILGQPSLPLDTTKKLLPHSSVSALVPTLLVRSTARRNRMGRQKQTKLPKNTHHENTHCHSRPPSFLPSSLVELFLLSFLPSFERPVKTKLLSTLIPPSFVPNSPLHSTSSARNLAVLSPPTSLAVWDQNQIYLFP